MAALQTQVGDLTQQVQTLTAQRDALPTFVMWNTRTTLVHGRELLLGLPDTFTVRIQFTATAPVRVRIMDLTQYARYINAGSVNALTYPATKNLDETFHDAEGCASYVAVLDAEQDADIAPNVTITRIGPGHGPTGACAN